MKQMKGNSLRRLFWGEGRLSVRFRNINILLFLLALCIMTLVMVAAFNNIISRISSDYARRYAISSADALSTHIGKEVGLLSAAAHSNAVIEWLADEGNEEKKSHAYLEMLGVLDGLYSSNLYIVVAESLNEYRIAGDIAADNAPAFLNALDAGAPEDRWYFDSIFLESEYTLSVAMDLVNQVKRVWIDHKIIVDGTLLGLICTGLEFSHITGELFSLLNPDTTRGLIINANGIVYMDSFLLGDEDFLQNDFESSIEETLSESVLVDAIRGHIDGIDGHFDSGSDPFLVELAPWPYRYATIAPIRHTNWSAVIIYDSSSSLEMPLFIPTVIAMLIVLIAFALASSAVSYRLIFLPFDKLRQSLVRLKDSNEENIYGTDRGDEIGELSSTIKDWIRKANYDALTGIHNRRFMENHLQHILRLLSRSNGDLSVLMVDVDYFKKFNDTFGHEKGDYCLRSVAQAVNRSAARSNDFAARYGGEEFAVILPNTCQDGACSIAEKLLENVYELKMPHPDSDVAAFVTVSVGVTTGRVSYEQSWEEYMKRADEAMYMSKQNGRNQYTFLELRKC